MNLEQMISRYIITSAQKGAKVNNQFYDNLLAYCDYRKAELLVLPMSGRSVDDDRLATTLEEGEGRIITKDLRLNSNIMISNWDIRPQQLLPLTGLARFSGKKGSFIYASPKQHFQSVPNNSTRIPKVLMTTGAVTHPYYRDNTRIGRIAIEDHTYGALVVEVEDNVVYHARHITALKNGRFQDLGLEYHLGEVRELNPEALVLGDWHTGDTNAKVRAATIKMANELRPKYIMMHDFFNGHSVNHHETGKIITLARNSGDGRLSLAGELKNAYKELCYLREQFPEESEIVIVASNHDDFLYRYLEEGRYIDDPQNAEIAGILFSKVIAGGNPLIEGLRLQGEIPEGIRFLDRDEDFTVRGWQLGDHGDKGANGARRGTVRAYENAYNKALIAHGHSPYIVRNIIQVGTSTELQLPYTSGLSSWMNSHGILYSSGNASLLNIINGRWTA